MPVARAQKERIPPKVRPFVNLGFNYDKGRISGKEAYGDCILCGKSGKFYVNTQTGQYSCKVGSCQSSGNIYTLLEAYWEKLLEEEEIQGATDAQWERLENDRGIPAELLQRIGIVWDTPGNRWVVPVRNAKGHIVNFRFYRWGKKLIGLPEMDTAPLFLDTLTNPKRKNEPVYVCEGEWDGIALVAFLEENEQKGIVIALPGSGVFKDEWLDYFRGRNVVLCYDADLAGQKGLKRAHDKLVGVARSQRMLAWPESVADGYDFRDFYNDSGTWEAFSGLLTEYREPELDEELETDELSADKIVDSFPLLSSGTRAPFSEVVKTFGEWLKLSPDMIDALRVIFAVVISNQIDGEPLWVHLTASPGFGKTELLMSVSGCSHVVTRSTVTAPSLVSGFQLSGGRDPSLVPQLYGKTFVIKDFTEILGMPKVAKDEIYSILRGAYDGTVEKTFGNGVRRQYKGYFSLISGVTPKIFGEKGAVLGERFLVFHLPKAPEADMTDVILAALENVGGETEMKEKLAEASRSFLEYRIEAPDIPRIPREYLLKIASLAQVVSMLRGSIEKDYIRDHVAYRPQFEVGTRVGKQLVKLALGLAIQADKKEDVDWEEIYRVVRKCGEDSCIGWNLEALKALAVSDGQKITSLSQQTNIPISTLRNQLEELILLGVIRREYIKEGRAGRPPEKFWISDSLRKHWERAGLEFKKTPLRISSRRKRQ